VPQAIKTARTVVPPSAPPPPSTEECAQISFRLGDVDMHLVNRTQLADLLAQVVRVESPVPWMEAARRALSGAGIQRLGNRIQQAFEEAVRLGVSRGLFAKRKELLWGPAMQQPPVRDRSELLQAHASSNSLHPRKSAARFSRWWENRMAWLQ
jgi:Protein of unknown function (DUF3320)